jgi:hypothetical protein
MSNFQIFEKQISFWFKVFSLKMLTLRKDKKYLLMLNLKFLFSQEGMTLRIIQEKR